jgi:hypothetical protein
MGDQQVVELGAKEAFPKDPVSQDRKCFAVVRDWSLHPKIPIPLLPNHFKLQISDHASPEANRQGLEGSATKPRQKMFRFLEPVGMLAPQEADGKCPDTRLPKS